MATAVLSDTELTASIAALESTIHANLEAVSQWERQEQSTASTLAEIRSRLAVEAEELALGKAKPETARKLSAEIADTELRLTGAQRILQQKRRAVTELRQESLELRTEFSQRERERQIAAERLAVHGDVANCGRALDDSTAAEKRFADGLHSLRSRTYLDPANQRFALNEAHSLTRRASGLKS